MRNFAAIAAAIVSLCALASCSQGEDGTTLDRKHRIDAAVQQADAAVVQQADAAVVQQADAAQTTTGGTVSCYTEGNPAQTCSSPDHCCFSNYSSQHDGYCTTSTCTYGTIDCDGPEDCGGGHCCSQPLYDNSGGLAGYSIGCQAAACGTAPGDHELCHIGGTACSNGGTCVSAYGTANDLPRTLDICK